MRKICLMWAGVWLLAITAFGQRAALKTNLLYLGTSTPNLTLEGRLAPQWTAAVTGSYNPWQFPSYDRKEGERVNPKLMHWLVMPEVKWWSCKAWEGHAVGLHAFYGGYNVGNIPFLKPLRDYRFSGRIVGGGASWTYHWALGERWGLETSVGAGYAFLTYNKCDGIVCGEAFGSFSRHYWGPTKAAFSVIYFIR